MTVPIPNISKKLTIDPKNNANKDIFLKLSISDIAQIAEDINLSHDAALDVLDKLKTDDPEYNTIMAKKLIYAKLIKDIDSQVGEYLPR